MFFIYRLDHKLQLALYRAVRALHTFSMLIPQTLTPALSHDPIVQIGHYRGSICNGSLLAFHTAALHTDPACSQVST